MINIKLSTVKAVTKFVVGRSVSYTVSSVIHNNVAPETKTQKVEIAIGSYVIGDMAAACAEPHVNAIIDDIAGHVARLQTQIKDAKKDK